MNSVSPCDSVGSTMVYALGYAFFTDTKYGHVFLYYV
jgi:hypothetical protein